MADVCLACRSDRLAEIEELGIDRIAEAWARDPARPHSLDQTGLRAAIFEDLGSDRVRIRRCSACGLEFAEPLRTWSADHYPDQRHGLGFDHQWALDRLATGPNRRVLELGCGNGEFLVAARRQGHHVAGVDFCSDAVRLARERGLDVHQADLNDPEPWSGQWHAFDVLAMFQIIEHLTAPEALFAALGRLAWPGATLLIGCPADRRYGRRFKHGHRLGRGEYWDYPPQHTLRWTFAALAALLDRHGWNIDAVASEPLVLLGAAAHLTAVSRANGSRWRRRLTTLGWLARLAPARLARSATGVRMVLSAHRVHDGDA